MIPPDPTPGPAVGFEVPAVPSPAAGPAVGIGAGVGPSPRPNAAVAPGFQRIRLTPQAPTTLFDAAMNHRSRVVNRGPGTVTFSGIKGATTGRRVLAGEGSTLEAPGANLYATVDAGMIAVLEVEVT